MTSPLLLLAIWASLERLGALSPAFVPGPGRVLVAAVELSSEGFARDILQSCLRIGAAFAVSAALAVPLGILMSSYKLLSALLEPLVDFVRYVPVPSLLPIFVLWFGIDEAPKFLILFFGTFFQLVLLVKDDADQVEANTIDVARTLGAGPRQIISSVVWPKLKPRIFDRLRVTLGWCWTYLVIAELLAVERGIGHVIKESQRFSSADRLFVCFFALGIIGLTTDTLFRAARSRIFPYTRFLAEA